MKLWDLSFNNLTCEPSIHHPRFSTEGHSLHAALFLLFLLCVFLGVYASVIPHSIANMSKLYSLVLSHNFFTCKRNPLVGIHQSGTDGCPRSFGSAATEGLHGLGNATQLQSLDLSSCRLQGTPLPLRQAAYFDPFLIPRMIVGPLAFPSFLYGSPVLASLKDLNLNSNNLTQELPKALTDLTSLKFINNRITGKVLLLLRHSSMLTLPLLILGAIAVAPWEFAGLRDLSCDGNGNPISVPNDCFTADRQRRFTTACRESDTRLCVWEQDTVTFQWEDRPQARCGSALLLEANASAVLEFKFTVTPFIDYKATQPYCHALSCAAAANDSNSFPWSLDFHGNASELEAQAEELPPGQVLFPQLTVQAPLKGDARCSLECGAHWPGRSISHASTAVALRSAIIPRYEFEALQYQNITNSGGSGPTTASQVLTDLTAFATAGGDGEYLRLLASTPFAFRHDQNSPKVFALEVKVGGKTASFKVLQPNVLDIALPSWHEVCGETCSGDYYPLTVTQTIATECISTAAATAAIPPRATLLSCPGQCGTLVNGPGLRYFKPCSAYLRGPQCLVVKFASQCAYGAEDQCRNCPANAFCPGELTKLPSNAMQCHCLFRSFRLFPCNQAATRHGRSLASGLKMALRRL